jgi:hypothetical protein
MMKPSESHGRWFHARPRLLGCDASGSGAVRGWRRTRRSALQRPAAIHLCRCLRRVRRRMRLRISEVANCTSQVAARVIRAAVQHSGRPLVCCSLEVDTPEEDSQPVAVGSVARARARDATPPAPPHPLHATSAVDYTMFSASTAAPPRRKAASHAVEGRAECRG